MSDPVKITWTGKDLDSALGKLLAQLPSSHTPPGGIVTFSNGGLHAAGYFMRQLDAKVPVYALPWSRHDHQWLPAIDTAITDYLRMSHGLHRSVLVLDDIFDTGSTIIRFLELLRNFGIPASFPRYAALAIKPDAFPFRLDGDLKFSSGLEYDKGDWVEFPWETI